MSTIRKVNIIYGLMWLLSFAIMFAIGVTTDSVTVYLTLFFTYLGVCVLGGIVVIYQKHKLDTWWLWILLVVSPGFFFPIAALSISPKRRAHRITTRPA